MSHEHSHEHTHEHGHGHEHTHEHGHTHSHSGSSKDEALLRYMLEHNRSHARELRETGQNLELAGLGDAAALIFDAVSRFDDGNARLGEAIELIAHHSGQEVL